MNTTKPSETETTNVTAQTDLPLAKQEETPSLSSVMPWYEKCDPADWLLEEYKLLSNHYFHEDNQYWKTISIFGTLNGALLAFLSSQFLNTQTLVKHFIPIVGVIFSISWTISLIRLREWRNYMERRIQTIEEYLHVVWGKDQFHPLDIRVLRDWNQQESKPRWFQRPYRIVRNMPASLSLLILPLSFLIIWIIIFILQLR